jgi:hypothetical protein
VNELNYFRSVAFVASTIKNSGFFAEQNENRLQQNKMHVLQKFEILSNKPNHTAFSSFLALLERKLQINHANPAEIVHK